MLTKVYMCADNYSENYAESKYLQSHCPVMSAVNILECTLPLIHVFLWVLKTKCTFLSLTPPPSGSECLGISWVTLLSGYFCGALNLKLHVGTVSPCSLLLLASRGSARPLMFLSMLSALSSYLAF